MRRNAGIFIHILHKTIILLVITIFIFACSSPGGDGDENPENNPPTLLALIPANGSTDALSNSNLSITFNESVTVNSGNIIIYNSDDTAFEIIDVTSILVTGTGSTEITIEPVVNFNTDSQYHVFIDDTVFFDLDNNSYPGISSKTEWTFQTAVGGGDILPPSIDILSPTDDSTDIAIDTNLVITFSENVTIDTGNINIFDSSDDSVIDTIDVTSPILTGTGTDTITIDLLTELPENTSVYIQIDALAFKDMADNYYAVISDKTTWNFTTLNDPAPGIIDYSPLNSDTDEPVYKNLILTFDIAVFTDIGNIQIYKTSDDSLAETIDVTSGQVTGSGTTVITIDPAVNLNYGTEYYVNIDATAFKDIADNYFPGISGNTTWSFKTELGVLYTNDFDYGITGGALTDITTDWAEILSGTTKIQYLTTGLSYTDYSSGNGGSFTGQNDGTNGEILGDNLNTSTSKGYVYFAFIVNTDSIIKNSAGFSVAFYNNDTILGGIRFKGKNATKSPQWYTITMYSAGGSQVPLNATARGINLVIVKYDFETDTLTGYLNPDVMQTEPSADGSIDLSLTPWLDINQIGINQIYNSETVPDCIYQIDGMKVVKDWQFLVE